MVVFGVLFASADAAFAALAERFLVLDVQVELLPWRIIVGIVCCALAGALALLWWGPKDDLPPSPWKLHDPKRARFQLAPAEWITCVVVLDGLFLLFVLVQLTVLFGGHARVLETTGLTYAEYARRGFFQLLLVAFLTLGVIAAVVNLGTSTRRSRFWMKVLLGILCVLTLVVLASALKRMNLYQEAFGFTRLRLLVDTTILWLGGVFVSLVVAGSLWKAAWMPRIALGLACLSLVTLNVLNADAFIARRNIARLAETGRLDVAYLSDLSIDAVPDLILLPDPERACVLASIAARSAPARSVWSWNLGRERAFDVLESYDLTRDIRGPGAHRRCDPLGLGLPGRPTVLALLTWYSAGRPG